MKTIPDIIMEVRYARFYTHEDLLRLCTAIEKLRSALLETSYYLDRRDEDEAIIADARKVLEETGP